MPTVTALMAPMVAWLRRLPPAMRLRLLLVVVLMLPEVVVARSEGGLDGEA